ncbi:MAG: class I SAM-dependent RNA methyltransferase [Lentisphaerae bacterium]|jgi:23S rRNA (uracil1939-C5)-methyltransferase|nr:class I SAM-dependent RNA methyltransferase [Lentisphaerota bacterium]MBT4818782.1 class I SAM-dependent RNA methyltransferase [Lentisphaerota bacterium]MBT5608391.1 class I SAM-dependent RNA methyltransferase [Lentisphaerota bacterium]MBT7054989.1 class I SAM-dependent RNA methyltransferase [Lentisphaerota bacterium]MBT7844814.1 class I SAM-dependent RNA methyltransferase [Lentisphaerota bacterium]
MQPGAEVELTIGDVAFGGDGVSRTSDGCVVFVPSTTIGDSVRAEVVSSHRHFSRAVVRELLTPGPGRCEPACPFYGRCGGCRYQHIDHATQVELKKGQLLELLRRVGRLGSVPDVDPIVPCPTPFGYRNRLRLQAFRPTAGDDRLEYGFCELDNETLFPVDKCPLASAEVNAVLAPAQRSNWARKNTTRPHPFDLSVRRDSTGRTVFFFGRAPRAFTWLTESVLGNPVRVPAGGFWQTNPAVAESLFKTVSEWFSAAPTPYLIDAYSGVGALSLAVGGAAKRRWLIERDPGAAEAASHNHTELGISSVTSMHGATEKVLPGLMSQLGERLTETTLLLDPPRSGCAGRLVEGLAASSFARILYVSCNPATLARDLGKMVSEDGYRLRRLALFDMFPQTAHFEVAALLERS